MEMDTDMGTDMDMDMDMDFDIDIDTDIDKGNFYCRVITSVATSNVRNIA